MQLIEIGSYLINPSAITYVSSRAERASGFPQTIQQSAVIHFANDQELVLEGISMQEAKRRLEQSS